MVFNYPLMDNNITEQDLGELINFLQQKPMPRLTQAMHVKCLEQEWSDWLGVKYSVFVNSGTMANYMSMAVLKHMFGQGGEIILPVFTWASDISSVIQAGFKPIFVDINLKNLCMDEDQLLSKINKNTKAVFMTYAQGFNSLTDRLLSELKTRNIPLIEDVCESHGATFKNKKLGSFGLMSNFSFYFAHHMSTIEGGMVCTNDLEVYDNLLMCRSHGMVREASSETLKQKYYQEYPDLNPEFIFAFQAYNGRGSELTAVLGRSQLKRLDSNNKERARNLEIFLKNLDSSKYFTEFDLEGNSNYAFPLIIREKNKVFREKLQKAMKDAGIEYRGGNVGGGNQLRQPYIQNIVSKNECEKYPNVEHMHFYGYYVGNYPGLSEDRIKKLCNILNMVN